VRDCFPSRRLALSGPIGLSGTEAFTKVPPFRFPSCSEYTNSSGCVSDDVRRGYFTVKCKLRSNLPPTSSSMTPFLSPHVSPLLEHNLRGWRFWKFHKIQQPPCPFLFLLFFLSPFLRSGCHNPLQKFILPLGHSPSRYPPPPFRLLSNLNSTGPCPFKGVFFSNVSAAELREWRKAPPSASEHSPFEHSFFSLLQISPKNSSSRRRSTFSPYKAVKNDFPPFLHEFFLFRASGSLPRPPFFSCT